MGLYNFQKRFAPFIMRGEKTHTIRALRAYPDMPGKTMHLYTGLRTKKAKLLMRVRCTRVESIQITSHGDVRVGGELLALDERNALAKRDGFGDFAEMLLFWRSPTNRLPFRGHIIHWARVL